MQLPSSAVVSSLSSKSELFSTIVASLVSIALDDCNSLIRSDDVDLQYNAYVHYIIRICNKIRDCMCSPSMQHNRICSKADKHTQVFYHDFHIQNAKS